MITSNDRTKLYKYYMFNLKRNNIKIKSVVLSELFLTLILSNIVTCLSKGRRNIVIYIQFHSGLIF